jgi:hypothetical protein
MACPIRSHVRQTYATIMATYLTNHNVCGLTEGSGVIRDEVLRDAIDTLTATVRALMRRCAIVNVAVFLYTLGTCNAGSRLGCPWLALTSTGGYMW